ncbi:MAG: hypothetical protein IT368_11865, partial [Candidatus Hydrogenedentes bacterium]|nr:hypothetical protein [Candidatus Hydrogenedentota bacterium]
MGKRAGDFRRTGYFGAEASVARFIGVLLCAVAWDSTAELIASFPLDSDPGWTTEGLWAYGVPQGLDGDPPSGKTGPNVYGYNLAGAFEANLPARTLTTTAIDCTAYEQVALHFWRWLQIETSQYDQASIRVSTNLLDWTTVWQHSAGDIIDTQWTEQTFDLAEVADGQATLYIQWVMGPTDEVVNYAGWNIDDIEITGQLSDPLQVTPKDGVNTRTPQGGPYPAISLTLSNVTANPLDWTAQSDVTWLVPAAVSGTLTGSGQEVLALSFTPDADALPVGIHTANISLTNVDTSITRQRSIAVRVLATATIPFLEDFEASPPLGDFWTVSGTGNFRTQVTTDFQPQGGSQHLTMDSTSGFARNELTLSVALKDHENRILRYWARSYGDEIHGPPAIPFIGGADFDGVAISADFETWYEIASLRSIPVTYTQFEVSLDDAITTFGLPDSPVYGIRFNQYDNGALTSDGIGLDNISVEGSPLEDLRVAPRNLAPTLAVQGNLPDPSQYALTIQNVAPDPIPWAVSADVAWLTFSPESGVLNPGAAVEVTAAFNAQAILLAPGDYQAEIRIANSPETFAVVRTASLTVTGVAQLPLVEDFEAGEPLADYWVRGGSGPYNNLVRTTSVPRGTRHLVLDSTIAGVFARNDATLLIDLANKENVELAFWAKQSGETSHAPPPSPFTGDANYDGVAVSIDGANWHEIFPLRNLSNTYRRYTVDLDAAFASAGL